MGRRKKPIVENLEIVDIVPDGKGVGKKDNMVYFVKDVIPQDVVNAVVIKNKSHFKEALPVKFIKKSPLRIEAKCKHFEYCGGCKWQNLKYGDQLKFKQKIVFDAFDRIAKVDVGQRFDILGSENTFFYRNKLEFTFSSRRWFTEDEIKQEGQIDANGLGFHLSGMFDRIIDIDECLLQSDLSNKIRNAVKEFAKQNKMDFFDTRNIIGFLRNLIIRNSVSTGEYMVILVVAEKHNPDTMKLLYFIEQNFPEVVSLYYIENTKKNDSYYDLKAVLYSGKKTIEETIGGLKFQIGPKSFFQTNPKQSEVLYSKALEFADLQGNEIVFDLYTGTGTIALYASQKAKKVYGIETIASAIDDAKKNAELNGITNAEFIVGDVETILPSKLTKLPKPDVIFLDPPRAGLHKDSVSALLQIEAPKIVYISCNPATQARDINILSEKYKVEKIQPVDMFPQTYHVENIALLRLK